MNTNLIPLAIYVHIPFCIRKCSYCDFLSFPASEEIQTEYMQALIKEISAGAEFIKAYNNINENDISDRIVTSIFFGGGTPSVPDPVWITRLMDCIRSNYQLSEDAEITMEMNPGTVSTQSLSIYRKSGINRISIGCQSMNDSELQKLGRIHDSKTFLETFRIARDCGFDNINVDLMSALPGQSIASYLDSLHQITDLHPEHISAYSLIIEEGTPFYELYKDVIGRDLYDVEDELTQKGIVHSESTRTQIAALPTEDEERQMYTDTLRILTESGFHRYEISNYASDKGNYECRHNKTYWERGDYLGFGIGAASLYDEHRFTNTRDITEYCNYWIHGIGNPGAAPADSGRPNIGRQDSFFSLTPYTSSPHAEEQILSIKEQLEETMFLGLREMRGISRTEFFNRFDKSLDDFYMDVIDKLCKEQLLIDDGKCIRLSEQGISLSNAVMSEFLIDWD